MMQFPIFPSTWAGLRVILLDLFVCISSLSMQAFAHDNVVVIPMAGNDVIAERLTNFAPLHALNPPNSAYTIGTDTVRDKITGLHWQKQDDNIVKNLDDAISHCGSLSLGGKDDWRLPSIEELQSIVSFSYSYPIINSTAFPNTDSSNYWSATTLASNWDKAWFVHFGLGLVSSDPKTDLGQVRCVRGLWDSTRPYFQNNNNGSVTDLDTGLIWQRQDNGATKNHASAVSYCNGLSLAGSTTWRLPSIRELGSIVDYRTTSPSIDDRAFFNTNGDSYWSASSAAFPAGHKWAILFSSGVVSAPTGSASLYVRCVR